MVLTDKVRSFFQGQLAGWQLAAGNYSSLELAEYRTVDIDGWEVCLQFNPSRIVSSSAKVDSGSVASRPCFLCSVNRPEVQSGLDFEGRYEILVNPYPIFPCHLTIPDISHVPQCISGRLSDMFLLAEALPGMCVFYNGPKCGASAPDHMHFQAGNIEKFPIIPELGRHDCHTVASMGDARLSVVHGMPYGLFTIDACTPKAASEAFGMLYAALPCTGGSQEPMMNVLAYAAGAGIVRIVVIPRKRHRPSFYGTEGEHTMLVSPASVDMGGLFIMPRRCDFLRMDAVAIKKIFDELCFSGRDIEDVVQAVLKK
ncbi:MAG TPA: DUF4922 domain-containing protein [Muribaculaceae bacterium]|nr:DUF4922 domain-containing protein [Muribaculaceae bacterium]